MWKDLNSLKDLFLGNNSISYLANAVFSNLRELKRLSLEYNSIKEISQSTFLGLTSLTSLNLWSNKLTEIKNDTFLHTRRLDFIELVDNRIMHIHADAFCGLSNVHSIYLGQNKIRSLNSNIFRNISSLSFIALSENTIKVLKNNTFNLPLLINLHFDKNNMSDLESDAFRGAFNLQRIFLRHNSLTRIRKRTFSNLPDLIRLYLGWNQIKDIEDGAFQRLPRLSSLELSNNKLTVIGKYYFQGLQLLNIIPSDLYGMLIDNNTMYFSLNLRENLIKTIEHSAFSDFKPKVQATINIDLSKNKLSSLSWMVFMDPSREFTCKRNILSKHEITVKVKRNNMSCSREQCWMRTKHLICSDNILRVYPLECNPKTSHICSIKGIKVFFLKSALSWIFNVIGCQKVPSLLHFHGSLLIG